MRACGWPWGMGCTRPAHARGLCAMHYQRAKARGFVGFPRSIPDEPPYEVLRKHGDLLCRCDGPRDDGECPDCRRPRLTPERIAWLRGRRGAAA